MPLPVILARLAPAFTKLVGSRVAASQAAKASASKATEKAVTKEVARKAQAAVVGDGKRKAEIALRDFIRDNYLKTRQSLVSKGAYQEPDPRDRAKQNYTRFVMQQVADRPLPKQQPAPSPSSPPPPPPPNDPPPKPSPTPPDDEPPRRPSLRMPRFARGAAQAAGSFATQFAGPAQQYAMGGMVQSGKQIMQGDLTELVKLPTRIRDWSQALVDSQRVLMQFNGIIAGAMVEAEMRTMQRQMRSGARTATSTRDLSKSLEDLKDEWQPISDTWTNVTNNVMESLTKVAGSVISIAKGIPGVKQILEEQEREMKRQRESMGAPFAHFMQDVAANNWQPVNRRRP